MAFYQNLGPNANIKSLLFLMAGGGKNIVLLVADDLGRNVGCYGEKAVSTPNLDELARNGTLFDMAFASTASCSGSRSVIYTGRHTHETGQYGLHHDVHHFTTYDDIETAPGLFNSVGYLTGIVGKVHVGPRSVYPWTFFAETGSRDVKGYAEKCEEFLELAKQEKRPFFLTVGFMDPHRDGTRGGFANNQKYRDVSEPDVKPEDVEIPYYLNDIPEVRAELVQYYKAINRMDQGVGMILKHLEEYGVLDDTLIVFLSDNGAPFINSKTTLYDAGIRLPLIVRSPNHSKGVVSSNLVSYIDILPTLLDWAGHAELKGERLGTSILSILSINGEEPQWQNHVFGSHTFHEVTNYFPTRVLRTKRYKYHRNVAWKLDFPFATDLYGSVSWEGLRNCSPPVIGGRRLEDYVRRQPEELYDLENDPQEITNLANDPQYKALLLDLRQRLEEWQLKTKDRWLFRDGVSVVTVKQSFKEKMLIPDRFDFDSNAPGTTGGNVYQING